VKPEAEAFRFIEIQEKTLFENQQANSGSIRYSGNKKVFAKRSMGLKWTSTGRRFE
jgi:hypothetical protein